MKIRFFHFLRNNGNHFRHGTVDGSLSNDEWDRGRFPVPRRKQQMNHTTEARGANLPAPRFAITLIFSPFFLETYHNDNSLYVKVLKFYLMWINSKKIRCTIRLWSKRIYLNHTDRAQSTFWRGLVVCLKRMMIYDYSF